MATSPLQAVLRAPVGAHLLRLDSRSIERPGWYQVITPSAPQANLNEVVHAHLEPGSVAAQVDRVAAAYAAHDLPWKWCVWPGQEPLGTALERRGYRSWAARGMVQSADHVIPIPGDVEVRQVGPGEAELYGRVTAAGWDMDLASAIDLARRALAAARYRLVVAWHRGQPIGNAGLCLHSHSGYLVGAAVHPEFRGHGAYRAMVAARLEHVRKAGLALATSHAREQTSAPILAGLGFETVVRYRVYQADPTPGV